MGMVSLLAGVQSKTRSCPKVSAARAQSSAAVMEEFLIITKYLFGEAVYISEFATAGLRRY